MSKLLIEPHYLGSLEYFALILHAGEVEWEVNAHFTKQTYKNRTHFMSAHGPVALSIPVSYRNHTPLKEVTIDYRQPWVREHWGACLSAYGKAPFFDFFADALHQIWQRKHRFLVDLNTEMMTICLQWLRHDKMIGRTKTYEKSPSTPVSDLREQIVPKKSFEGREFYIPFPYVQTFGSKFVPNLSIVDLLMSEGPNAKTILLQSSGKMPVNE